MKHPAVTKCLLTVTVYW